MLTSNNYILIRNALTYMIRVIFGFGYYSCEWSVNKFRSYLTFQCFSLPIRRSIFIVSLLKKFWWYLRIEVNVATVRDAEKGKRSDLNLLASSYLVIFWIYRRCISRTFENFLPISPNWKRGANGANPKNGKKFLKSDSFMVTLTILSFVANDFGIGGGGQMPQRGAVLDYCIIISL